MRHLNQLGQPRTARSRDVVTGGAVSRALLPVCLRVLDIVGGDSYLEAMLGALAQADKHLVAIAENQGTCELTGNVEHALEGIIDVERAII